MAGFQVKPSALEGYAKALGGPNGGGASLDTQYLIDANDYLEKWVKPVSGPGSGQDTRVSWR